MLGECPVEYPAPESRVGGLLAGNQLDCLRGSTRKILPLLSSVTR